MNFNWEYFVLGGVLFLLVFLIIHLIIEKIGDDFNFLTWTFISFISLCVCFGILFLIYKRMDVNIPKFVRTKKISPDGTPVPSKTLVPRGENKDQSIYTKESPKPIRESSQRPGSKDLPSSDDTLSVSAEEKINLCEESPFETHLSINLRSHVSDKTLFKLRKSDTVTIKENIHFDDSCSESTDKTGSLKASPSVTRSRSRSVSPSVTRSRS